MSRIRTLHRCTDCGAASPQWAGRCSSCGEWNSLIEEVEPARPAVAGARSADRPVPILEVDAHEWAPRPTGVGELDRVLGGGLVPGSVTLLGGEPGIGKSTLLLQAAGCLASAGARCLLVSAEESKQQVRLRAERLGTLHPRVLLLSETDLTSILQAVEETGPDVLVVDSIQTVHDPAVGSTPGSVAQVRECASQFVKAAKSAAMATVLVGHVTKDGSLAGPRVLEHLVDTVLSFEGDRHHALRLLRSTKHRFASTGELGLFEMAGSGLVGVADPSRLLLGDRTTGVAGSTVVPTMEGHRPLLVEVQALVSTSELAMPRRSAQGLDPGRLSLLLAVLSRRAGVAFGKLDVYASAVGGVRITEPGADLGVALALASAAADVPIAPGLVACGEVGLAGELRQVSHTPRRLAEAARLGFSEAVVPASAPDGPPGLRLRRVASLAEAVATTLG
ncbi:MAG: DNA repair protein RadA [Actinobacteria bacterium]|nr:DNA repair protein RadA [Actinomycetota bacterium]MBW3651394.1 DNA repair protein RadA [Actinomycetota bacterium]